MVNIKQKNERRQNNLNIMSWNIRSRDTLTGNKSNDKDFVDILKKHDIFCLQETRKEIKIPDYTCFNRLRDNGRGGGVCIGVKRSLTQGISKISTLNKNDILGIKLNKHFFKTDQDIILVTCYVPPSNSTYLKKQEDPFESICSVLDSIDPANNIILCGDFNARTGGIEDRVLCDKIPGLDSLEDVMECLHLSDRNCMDRKKNTHGTNLLDLCLENNLAVINGRTSGDLFGDLTYVNYCGASVIDYFATSQSLYGSINYMRVEDLNNFSDHRPISLSISTLGTRTLVNETFHFSEAPIPFIWDSDSADTFTDAQLSKDTKNMIIDLSNNILNSSKEVLAHNQKFCDLLIKIASDSLAQRKAPPPWRNKNGWFDSECRTAKRKLNKEYRAFNVDKNHHPSKANLFEAKRQYNKLLKSKKRTYFANLNKEIENDDLKNINWKKFKKLKSQNKEDIGFDDYDLQNFYTFFKQLYHDHRPLQQDTCSSLRTDTTKLSDQFLTRSDIKYHSLLNDNFTIDELNTEIRKLKTGKSVSLDLISNDMIKHLNIDLRAIVLNLFNGCLNTGTYPWLTSVMTPIHKTGDKYNPDNYRAIALGSCLGKLFSNLLLSRIQNFRSINCPDLPNQLGFTPLAQTSDHILSLKTLIDKYTNKKGAKLYACFVDYRKAFDSVARDALLYKLAKLGIGGNIFRCLKNMYENSGTKIKLINKLSEAINLKNGVEQGHPLSPELFKIYILDLSHQLELALGNFPKLKNKAISHLLWADDLVLLALDEDSLQATLNILNTYCESWGLQINPKKTKVIIFNKSGRFIRPKNILRLGEVVIESTNSYCYLGIIFIPSGSFKNAIYELKKKALRAIFSLKRFIYHKCISITTIFRLFDALILPILTYACQITFPYSKIASSLVSTKTNQSNWQGNWLTKVSNDPFEKLHLRFIKWTLGVHKKSSNVGAWGETGRHPIGIQMLKQTVNYFNRVSLGPSSSSLVHLSFLEQQSGGLKWYASMESLIAAHGTKITTKSGATIISPGRSAKSAKSMFEAIWKGELTNSPKLDFYKKTKFSFSKEPYLDYLDFDLRQPLTKLRISAHKLPVEQGRYLTPPIPRSIRYCEVCKAHDDVTVLGDEQHLLFECRSSKLHREVLSSINLNLIENKNNINIFDLTSDNARTKNLAVFVKRSYTQYTQDASSVGKLDTQSETVTLTTTNIVTRKLN